MITREEVILLGGTFRNSGRIGDIRDMKMVWCADDETIRHTGGRLLESDELTQLKIYITQIRQQKEAEAHPAPPAEASPRANVSKDTGLKTEEDKKHLWVKAALEAELTALAHLPEENINKPGSQFSIHLLKIASICNGGGRGLISHSHALSQIEDTCQIYPWLQVKEIRRQWGRAIQKAVPRYPADTYPLPVERPTSNGRIDNSDQAPATTDKANNQGPEKLPNFQAIKYPKTHHYWQAFTHLGFNFHLNEMDDSIEISTQKTANTTMTEFHEAIVANRVQDLGLNYVARMKNAYLEAAYRNKYHPLKNYLNSLQWDENDHIGNLIDNYLTTDDDKWATTAFRRWMIGAVAKVFEQKQNFMLVWDSAQGIGKSTLARWLCPHPAFFIEGSFNTDDKDTFLRMCRHFIWELGELQHITRRADREAMKDAITKRIVTIRKPYGRGDINKPSLVSFIGTINEDGAGFLTDPTGNRRFVIVKIEKIRHDYITELDTEQLWAQAIHLYRAGEPHELTPTEAKKRDIINARYEMDSIVAEYFVEQFEVTGDENDFTTTKEIIKALTDVGLKGNQRANMNELARLMKKWEVKAGRASTGNRQRGYFGVRYVQPVNA